MNKIPPRKVPSRDEKYMGLAFWVASFSKDPNTQVGAVIIDKNNSPLGYGYNGPPRPIDDKELNWDRPYKYDFIKHAEENAIAHCPRVDLEGSIIYVTAKPCSKCMLTIVASGIKKVVYFPHRPKDQKSSLVDAKKQEITEEIANKANVVLEKFNGNLSWIRDRIKVMEDIGVFD
jgi:dCMP deaminase